MSYHIAYWGVALSAAAALLSFAVEWRRGSFRWLPIYAALLVPHPGWRLAWHELHEGVRAVSSDCGYGNRFISLALLLAMISVLLLVFLRPAFDRRWFLLSVAAVCWALHATATFLFRPPLSAVFPLSWPTATFFQETVEAIDFGQMRIWFFTIGLTLLCIVLYIPWRRLRRHNEVK